eukprot:scaffold4820_cov67-Phaeocystis_antarctica.AAC.4
MVRELMPAKVPQKAAVASGEGSTTPAASPTMLDDATEPRPQWVVRAHVAADAAEEQPMRTVAWRRKTQGPLAASGQVRWTDLRVGGCCWMQASPVCSRIGYGSRRQRSAPHEAANDVQEQDRERARGASCNHVSCKRSLFLWRCRGQKRRLGE